MSPVVKRLLLGAAVGMPIGIVALRRLPAGPLQVGGVDDAYCAHQSIRFPEHYDALRTLARSMA